VRGEELHPCLPFAALPDRVHDIGAVAPARDHVRDQLGRVLEVGVDHHHGVAARVLEAGGDRGLVAEVARERDHLDPLVGRGELGEQPAGPVLGAVVGDHQLPVPHPLQCRRDPVVERADVALLVPHRGDDAQEAEWAG
jgi:hypothetical protein